MGIMLGIGLKLAAQKLLSSAFTRGGKEKPEQDLDSYRELDQRFETKELPKEPPNIVLAPKEQFKESIGDRGYGLSEENKSLYDRLTEDMKSIIDSNYEIAENLNRKLDYTNEVAKTANANALNAAQVSATYGKMNQEAIVGLSQKSGSKIGGLVKGIWEGIKKTVGGIFSIIAGAITSIPLDQDSSWGGRPEDNPEAAKVAEDAEDWEAQMAAEKERAKAAARAAKADLKSRTVQNNHGNKTVPEGLPNGYNSNMETAFNSFFNSSWYDSSLSGSEALDLFIKYTGRNNKGFTSPFNSDVKGLNDDEKSSLWEYLFENQALRNKAKEEEQNAKNAEAAQNEAGEASSTAHSTVGFSSLIKSGLVGELKDVERLRYAAYMFSKGLTVPENIFSYFKDRLSDKYSSYKDYEDDPSSNEIKNLGKELTTEAERAIKSLDDEVRAGDIFTEDELVTLGIKDENGKWKRENGYDGNYGNNSSMLYSKLLDIVDDTYHNATGNYIDWNSFQVSDTYPDKEFAASESITTGDIKVKRYGNYVDTSKTNNGVTQISEYIDLDSGENIFNYNKGYEFENSLTGETITGTGRYGEVTAEDIYNESSKINEFKSILDNLGVSVEDIGSMSNKQMLDLAERMGTDNEVIMYMLSRIWLNTINNKNVTIIDASGSGGLDPGD